MHKDTQEALERLEAELLAEEQPNITDEELDDLLVEFPEDDSDIGDPGHYRNFANGYRAYNSDDTDADLDVYSDEVYEEPRKHNAGALILALVCFAGAVAALLFMAARML